MATIYADQHTSLKELLANAGRNEAATLLIPELQRPYVWQPKQVIVLIDSLIRGWPFGTLLTWKVKQDDPARELARPFWRVVDRVDEDEGETISKKNPPATFQMVLDGQQRIQSLLLALGGDGWGFKLYDRRWHEDLKNTKQKGRRGKDHWSLGCLCVDVPALNKEYAKYKRATSINYVDVLQWVVTDASNGQSKLARPQNYNPPLLLASETGGRFVRLARLWDKAPDQSIDNYEAETIADTILSEHSVPGGERDEQKRALGALLIALRDVKQTRVTYLELAEYDASHSAREVYNDAIVNIFTRLNTAGRTLTREDITFAWLKIGWDVEASKNESAKECIDSLVKQLDDLDLPLGVEDVISVVSFVWSASFNEGKLLNNNDLMQGDAIRPMAKEVSKNWHLIKEAIIQISEYAKNRGLRFREHYQSVNALSYLYAWYFIGVQWGAGRGLKETDKDSLEKRLEEALDKYMDRWLICSQWAGVWTSSNAPPLSRYALVLAVRAKKLGDCQNVVSAADTLASQVEADLKDIIEQAAIASLAEVRQEPRTFNTALWLWNRLDKKRWNSAKLALRQNKGQKNKGQCSIEVDHIVSRNLWKNKLSGSAETTLPIDEDDVNQLGNYMLLEKNFNISKSKNSLKTFLDGVYEFKEGKLKLEDWAEALDLEMPQVDSSTTDVQTLQKLFSNRTLKIRDDLEKFVKGEINRIDLEAN